jgi:acyl-CoA thioesterase I
MISLWLSAMYPEVSFKFVNKGVSRDRIKDLKSRWQNDTLNLKPDILSILIGINDISGSMFNGPTSVSDFTNDFRFILQKTTDSLPCKIILMEPFMLIVSKKQANYQDDLRKKCKIIRELSREFNTLLVPLDTIFKEAADKREPTYWLQDGFHPTPIGNALIAQSWLKAWSQCLLEINSSSFKASEQYKP